MDGRGSKRVSVLLKHHGDGTMLSIGMQSVSECQTLMLDIFLCFVSDVTFNVLMVLAQFPLSFLARHFNPTVSRLTSCCEMPRNAGWKSVSAENEGSA